DSGHDARGAVGRPRHPQRERRRRHRPALPPIHPGDVHALLPHRLVRRVAARADLAQAGERNPRVFRGEEHTATPTGMRVFTVGSWPLAAYLLLGSCATAPPPPPAPAWTEVPRGVLDAFCARLHDEGISAETAVEVVCTTQPLITPQTISGLAEAAAYANRFDPFTVSEQAN